MVVVKNINKLLYIREADDDDAIVSSNLMGIPYRDDKVK